MVNHVHNDIFIFSILSAHSAPMNMTLETSFADFFAISEVLLVTSHLSFESFSKDMNIFPIASLMMTGLEVGRYSITLVKGV
jgi:hypothetical protein